MYRGHDTVKSFGSVLPAFRDSHFPFENGDGRAEGECKPEEVAWRIGGAKAPDSWSTCPHSLRMIGLAIGLAHGLPLRLH